VEGSTNLLPELLLKIPVSSSTGIISFFLFLYSLNSGRSVVDESKSQSRNTRSALQLVTVLTGALFIISAVMNFGFKIPLGFSELSFSSPSVSIAEFELVIGLALLIAAVFSRLYIYGGALLLAMVGITSGLASTEVQDLARSLHELMLPLAITGIILLAIESRTVYNSRTDRRTTTRDRQMIIVLQFFVGALVTFGGLAYARSGTFPYGAALGLIHLSVGLTGLFAFYTYVKNKPWSRTFLIIINAVTMAYSAFSESLAQIYSLLTPGINDSLIGTIIAIIVSGVIIYLLRLKGSSAR